MRTTVCLYREAGAWRIVDGEGELGEDEADFVRGDHGATRGDEFAGGIGRAMAPVRGVGMGVAEAVEIARGGEGAAASVGESKLASSVCEFGLFRRHAGRILCCVYSLLVTGMNNQRAGVLKATGYHGST
jgi:hypothetical protein